MKVVEDTFAQLPEKEKVKLVREWCEKQVDEGLTVSVEWDGGNDSGCVNWSGDSEENIFTDFLVDQVYDELDYGSWAGDFSASGTMIYNKEQKALVGQDYYSETEYVAFEEPVKLVVPEKYYFDQINCSVSGHDQYDGGNITIEAFVTNGFVDPELEQYLKEKETEIATLINDKIRSIDIGGNEFLGIDSADSYTREDFEESEGLLSVTMEIHYREDSVLEKDVSLNLNEEEYGD